MIRILLLTIIICLKMARTSAQCVTPQVTIPSEVCRESVFSVENNTPSAAFEWDLCPVDLDSTPSILKVMNTGLTSTIDLELAEDNGDYYGFALDATSNSLVRLDFGDSRDNVPAKTNLGNINGEFEFPNSIAIVRQNQQWVGIVANGANGKVLRLNFGSSLQNVPTASLLHTRAGGGFANVTVASTSSEGRALLIAEYNTRQLTVLDYSQGFLLPSDAQQAIFIPGSNPIDVQAVKVCDQWQAIVLSFDNRKLYSLDFGDSFANVANVAAYDVTLGFEPYRLSVVREGEIFRAFVSSTSGGITRLDFQSGLDNIPSVVSIGSFGVLSNSRSLFMDAKNGKWRAFMINFSDGNLFRLSFQGECGVAPSWSENTTPGEIEYSLAGTHRISLTTFEANGTISTTGYEVIVRNDVAPQIDIQSINSCVNHEVYFTAQITQGTISNFEWEFGDGSNSSAETPSHRYSIPNVYNVSLKVTGDNSCINQDRISVDIFEKPLSDFSLSSPAPLCTNQLLTFTNTSDFQENSSPYWRWFINSVEVSVEKDLSQALSTPGPHRVKLIAAIPGCESVSEQLLGPLTEGPRTAFDYTGICLGQATEFVNSSSGDIQAFQWEFGDGQTSTEKNPLNTFANLGQYEVALTAIGASGCNVRKSRIVQIRSVPVPDFRIPDPPLSCSGTESIFYNQSTNPDSDQIKQWLWTFSDGTQSNTATDENLQHTFEFAGVYQVSLSATTASGCVATREKQIVIHESPAPDFSYTPACDKTPVSFSTVSDLGIGNWYWEIGTSYYATASPTHTFRNSGDFPVHIELTGNNGCVSSLTKIVHVPETLWPDFSVIKNCVNDETLFTDVTTGIDPVMSRQWDFGTGLTTGSSRETHLFTRTGSVNVTLRVTAQSGCTYQKTKEVQIFPSPQAAFTASPESGAYPLEVQFTNLSSQSAYSHWEFADETGRITEEISPVHTFVGHGSFDVTLTSYNAEQCESSLTKTITTFLPMPDVEIEVISVLPNSDGSAKLIITVNNKGNTILRSLPITIDFGGKLSLQQVVEESIFPSSKYNYLLSTSIADVKSLPYLCVTLDLNGDVTPSGNWMCKDLQNKLHTFSAHPNPVKDELNVEWISQSSGVLQITVADGLGRQVFVQKVNALAGLNRQRMLLQGIRDGLYTLVIDDGETRRVQRILIQNAP